ncbi:hypothetical protein E3N88_14255 [Mikania micrantha]|uniref:Phospho-N-acetylmuramoyl-pentapeptide-transferase n=1 Tax=Mikania micrantha TaxID=192012 RepID=A0A5N6P412_9ASTR|nr:hypothetical protein E3N88_14255 [Mikania micrantha]
MTRGFKDSVSDFSLDDRADSDGSIGYMSSEGEESDGDIVLNPITEVDIPTTSEQLQKPDAALTATAHELRMIGKSHSRSMIKYGIIINIALVTFLTVFLLLLDSHAWRIVRLPLPPFHLIYPFTASAILVSFVGYICVPLFRISKMRMIISKWPARRSSKKGTTTMGGLFLVPIGVIVAEVLVGFSSIEVLGASIATLAFATIGLMDDFLCLVKRRRIGVSPWIRNLLEVAVGTWFYFWLCARNISSPYSIKMVVPLPLPMGLVCMGGFYLLLTSFCFVSMANGMELTDGLDGLAGGTAALSFIGMSIAVLPICSDLAVFGASMAGACVGFLFHNRYKASVFMGDTGALALGGALAAMAASTGMFFPLLISSGVIVLEAISVLLQCVCDTNNWYQSHDSQLLTPPISPPQGYASVIPSLKRKLILIEQLDNEGHDVKFSSGQWKVVKGNPVVARGKKKCSLYMVEIPPEGVRPYVYGEGLKSVKPVSVGGCCNSGSTKKNRVSVAILVKQWVKRTIVSSVKVSLDYCLLGLESEASQFISDAGRVTVELQCELTDEKAVATSGKGRLQTLQNEDRLQFEVRQSL